MNTNIKFLLSLIFELRKHVKQLNSYRIEKSYIDIKNCFINEWIKTNNHSEFLLPLSGISKIVSYIKNVDLKNNLTERENAIYYLGKLNGMKEVYQELLKEEDTEKRVEYFLQCNPTLYKKILSKLYHENFYSMKHIDLAKELGVTSDFLSFKMANLLKSGTINTDGIGKNIFYYLSDVGITYCIKNNF